MTNYAGRAAEAAARAKANRIQRSGISPSRTKPVLAKVCGNLDVSANSIRPMSTLQKAVEMLESFTLGDLPYRDNDADKAALYREQEEILCSLLVQHGRIQQMLWNGHDRCMENINTDRKGAA